MNSNSTFLLQKNLTEFKTYERKKDPSFKTPLNDGNIIFFAFRFDIKSLNFNDAEDKAGLQESAEVCK